MNDTCRRRWNRSGWTGLVVVLCAATAYGHDSMQITTVARLRPDGLQLRVMMARSTALSSCTSAEPGRSFDPEAFDNWKPLLKQGAMNLFEVTAGDETLALREVEIELTPEDDIDIVLVYPRPVTGPLRFHAGFLKKLPDGYGTTMSVIDEIGKELGWSELMTAEADLLEVAWPTPVVQTVSPQPVPATPARPVALPVSMRGALVAAVLVVILGAGWLVKRCFFS